jgi:hypothetical protein
MTLYRRYSVEAMGRCPICNGVGLALKAVGGAPGDPAPKKHSVPEPENPVIYDDVNPFITGFVKALTGSSIMMGRGSMRRVGGDQPEQMVLDLSPEEYDTVKPLNIGDLLEIRVNKVSE